MRHIRLITIARATLILPLLFVVRVRADQDSRSPAQPAPKKDRYADSLRATEQSYIRDGGSPLGLSAMQGNIAELQRILSTGTSVDAADHFGWTALAHAAQFGQVATVQFLLSRGADVNRRNGWNDTTALIQASYHGRTAIVKLLLDAHADVNAAEKQGRTPLSVALQEGHRDILLLLQKAQRRAPSPALGRNSATIAPSGQSASRPQEIPGSSVTGPWTDPLNHDIVVRVTVHYEGWLQTGIFVYGGQIVRFEAHPLSWACGASLHCAGPEGDKQAGLAKNSPAAQEYPSADAPPLALLARFGQLPGFAVGLYRDVAVPPGKWELLFADNVRESERKTALGGHEVRIIVFDRPRQPDPPHTIQFDTYDRMPQPSTAEERLFPFCGGAARAAMWGYINSTGKVVIPPTFKGAAPFSEGLGRVQFASGKYGFLDAAGRPVVPARFDDAGDFHDGLARVTVRGKSGFIDRGGAYAIQPTIGEGPRALPWAVTDFSDGLAQILELSGRQGFIDRSGALALGQPIQYDGNQGWIFEGRFSEGLAAVQFGQRGFGYIDKTGNVVIPPKFKLAANFSEGVAPVQMDGKYGYIDRTGRVVIDFIFTSADKFSEGLASVEIAGKWGCISKSGTVVVQPKFDTVREFSGGLAGVLVGRKWGFIDKLGNIRVAPQFKVLFTNYVDFSQGLALVELSGGGYAYVDREGRVVARTSALPTM